MGIMQLMLEVLLLLCFFKLGSLAEASVDYSLSKSNCLAKCGNITFPFPFGIGHECFMDDWYEIVCKDNNSVPWLKKLDLQVLNVSLNQGSFGEDATIIVNYPITYSDVGCRRNQSRPSAPLKGSPYILSSAQNVYVAVGCNNLAMLECEDEPLFLGCKTRCAGANTSRYSACNGYDCCQTRIPSGMQAFNIDVSMADHNTGPSAAEGDCRFAFLVQQDKFHPSQTDLYALQEEGYLPVVLQWGVQNTSFPGSLGVKVNSGSRSPSVPSLCHTVSKFSNTTPFITCFCNNGYDGNPYFLGGCRDVNECENDGNLCAPHKCRNLPGTFQCVKDKRTALFIVIGVVSSCGSLVLIILAWLVYTKIKKRREAKLRQKFFKRNGGHILQQHLLSAEGNAEKGRLFSSNELDKATDYFNKDRVVGKGGHGTVYKGMLADGRIVAIKKSLAMEEADVEIFINEVLILSQINHRNVVKLLGCCLESEAPLLVYEFIANGTLYQYLNDKESPVSWAARLRIAAEIAGALFYLHSSASTPIYHRDVKSSNILLDDKHQAKIADFGTSRTVALDQTHVTTLVQGTFGYLDPEYFQSSQFTDKSDVYSFGVVLVELLTGQKPVSSTRTNEGRSLALYFMISMENNLLLDILDAPVKEQGREEDITAVARLAKRCLNLKGRKRPTMKEVLIELEGIRNSVPHESSTDQDQGNNEGANATTSAAGESDKNADVISQSDIDSLLPSDSW
ncbi:hypothetical protein SAY86_019254 [Trapa natans]|uniref:Protein kinase domain-containing protein n=1 Tax=Trapa natans TaxID=22666 RepID=A0AAN7LEK3_TRANT|nr:hypothetical protein SAY86_019254 [Trapa natans]